MSFQTFRSTEAGSITPTEWAQTLIEAWHDGTGYMHMTWPGVTTVEVFVDESRWRDYLLCAVVVASAYIVTARRAMRDLKPNNRNRHH
ncbi:hypothetical protein CH263_19460 [Rhodococcus sp. 06-1059B-a]|nr:hypothetical protein [Rhodococcus sp. 06-1059B-a]OZD61054.1 hypothetical protein CH263_19460 [Rhodococcus sp. 06-1059B-a]